MKQKPCSRLLQARVFLASLCMGTVPVLQCTGGNCFSCLGCVGVGGLAVGMGLWETFCKAGTKRRMEAIVRSSARFAKRNTKGS